jgi:hypothetical protein
MARILPLLALAIALSIANAASARPASLHKYQKPSIAKYQKQSISKYQKQTIPKYQKKR